MTITAEVFGGPLAGQTITMKPGGYELWALPGSPAIGEFGQPPVVTPEFRYMLHAVPGNPALKWLLPSDQGVCVWKQVVVDELAEYAYAPTDIKKTVADRALDAAERESIAWVLAYAHRPHVDAGWTEYVHVGYGALPSG